jgi:hypothetical protein
VKRTIVIGSLLGALLIPLGGCADLLDRANEQPSDKGPAASPTPSPPPQPAEVFAKAITGLDGKSLKFTIAGEEGVFNGTTDSASGGVKLTAEIEGTTVEIVTIGNDVYLGGLVEEGKYVHAQVSKFKDTAIALLYLIDPLFGQKFLSTATNIAKGEPNTFTGTMDLTKVATTGPAQRLAVSFAKSAGAAATAVPFTATIDPATGALASLKTAFPKADKGKELKYDLKITEVGGANTIAAPPKNKTSEAPSAIYSGP